MRHLGSLLLSIVLGAVAYVLAGIGYDRLETAFALHNPGYVGSPLAASTNWTDVGYGAGGLVLAGLLIAVLVLTPISPVGPLVAGVVYIAAEFWFFFDPSSLEKVLGKSILGNDHAAEAPLLGIAFVAAIPLIATIVIPHRWRSKHAGEAEEGTGSPVPPLYQPSYETGTESFSAAPQYPTSYDAPPTQGLEVPAESTGETRTE